MAGKFDLKKTDSGKFMFNLCAGNGQVILTSEQYESKASAVNGIESVKTNCINDSCFDRKESKAGQPFFSLCSTNGQIVGQSQMYSSAGAMEAGISSVKENAPTAEIVEQTA